VGFLTEVSTYAFCYFLLFCFFAKNDKIERNFLTDFLDDLSLVLSFYLLYCGLFSAEFVGFDLFLLFFIGLRKFY
jgi:hypothetical protein